MDWLILFEGEKIKIKSVFTRGSDKAPQTWTHHTGWTEATSQEDKLRKGCNTEKLIEDIPEHGQKNENNPIDWIKNHFKFHLNLYK